MSQCPSCHTPISSEVHFCPNCGYHFAEQVSVGRQVWIYFVSLFLPPLGLIWVFKYIRSQNTQLKRIALIAIILTILSSLVTIWFSISLFQGIQNQLNSYSSLGL